MELFKQLTCAIDYIEDNLKNEISYNKAAQLACCSNYNFQRIFSYISGVSLSEYIRRRKMTLAAFEIQTGKTKIMDIAMKYGYKSPTSFNRAFQNIHGVTPVEARNKGIVLSAYPRINFSINVTGNENIEYKIEKKESFKISGLKIPLKEDYKHNFRIVPKFWNEILNSQKHSNICNLSDCNSNILGISHYKNSQDINYYIAVKTNKPTPKDMFELEIPSALWVIFKIYTPFEKSVQNIFKYFLTQWLPFSNYEYAYLPDIEVYPINKNNLKNNFAEVWISIKQTNKNKY